MISDQLLRVAGYQFHRSRRAPSDPDEPHIPRYRKVIREGGVLLYTIDVWAYERGEVIGYAADAQFRVAGIFVDVAPLFPPETEIAQVEAFFGVLYRLMGCEPHGWDRAPGNPGPGEGETRRLVTVGDIRRMMCHLDEDAPLIPVKALTHFVAPEGRGDWIEGRATGRSLELAVERFVPGSGREAAHRDARSSGAGDGR